MPKLKKLTVSSKQSTNMSQVLNSSLEKSENFKEKPDSSLSQENSTAPNSDDQLAAFEKVISESKAEIAATEEKKTRGRKKLPRDENGNIIREQKPADISQPVAMQPPDKAVIKATIEMPFNAIAARTGCPAIALEPEIADGLASQAVPVVQTWFPAMQSKETALVLFGVSIASVAFSKWMIYKEWLKTKELSERVSS